MIGNFIQQPQGYQAFIPNKFPLRYLEISNKVFLANDIAILALGKLDGIAQLIPDIGFLQPCMLKKNLLYLII